RRRSFRAGMLVRPAEREIALRLELADYLLLIFSQSVDQRRTDGDLLAMDFQLARGGWRRVVGRNVSGVGRGHKIGELAVNVNRSRASKCCEMDLQLASRLWTDVVI